MMKFNFNNPTNLLFGKGTLHELGKQSMPGKKALVLISNGKSIRENGYLDRTLEQLEQAGVTAVVFDKIMENPLKDVIMEGAAAAKEHNCDFIVALGGGAVLDASKMIAAMATNDGDLWEYAKGRSFDSPGIPIVTIATTSGTGSEINCSGVISNPETQEKIGFGHPSLTPVLAVVDPELMMTVPAKYTAYQGFDALFHNTEVCISSYGNVMSEELALTAIAHISTYLPRAVKDGNDLEAREHVAYGSTIAGMSMQLAPTTAAHSMEHSMSAYHHNLPHGAGLIMIAKEFYQFFIDKKACDEQFIKMAKAMGMEDADKPQDFITALLKLQEACGVADLKMSDYGFDKSESMTLAKGARDMQGILFMFNPCEMMDDDCAGVFERSYQ